MSKSSFKELCEEVVKRGNLGMTKSEWLAHVAAAEEVFKFISTHLDAWVLFNTVDFGDFFRRYEKVMREGQSAALDEWENWSKEDKARISMLAWYGLHILASKVNGIPLPESQVDQMGKTVSESDAKLFLPEKEGQPA